MAAEEIPASLSCAQCEIASATLECIDEELLYCAPCSASLHSKRARLHHSVLPFQTCDECEAAVARMRCASCAGRQSEPLVFCVNCSALLHSKKARHHHQVEPISSPCKQEGVLLNESKDEKTEEIVQEAADFTQTEDAIASGQDATQGICVRVASLGCEQSSSLSTDATQGVCMHVPLSSCQQRLPLSREEEGQGPTQSSKQDSLLSNRKDASTQANTPVGETGLSNSLNTHNTQKAAREDGAALLNTNSPLQGEDPSVNASQEAGIADGLDVCKDASKREDTAAETEPILTRIEEDGAVSMKKSPPSNKQEAPLSSTYGVASELPTLASIQEEPISSRGHDALLGLSEGLPTSHTENVAPTSTQPAPLFSTPEASVSSQQYNTPFSSAEETAKNSMANAPKGAYRPGMPESLSQIHFAQPPFPIDHLQGTPDSCHHPHPQFHTSSPCQGQFQGPHTPPPFQSHLFPHCTPLIPRHVADSTWPVRAMDFSHTAFHGNQYHAGSMTPPCQSCALVSPPGYIPYSNPYYTGFIPQVDHSSSAYMPPRLYEHSQPVFPHENLDSIRSKSNDWQVPGSNKRLRSSLYEVNTTPTIGKGGGGEGFAGNLLKRIHIGEGPTSENSPNVVNLEGTARIPPKNVLAESLPEGSSKKAQENCIQGASSLEQGHIRSSPGHIRSSPGEAISEKDSKGKSSIKVAPCHEVSPSIVSEVPPEEAYREDFMPGAHLEKVSATETCGKVSETAACSSGAASEQAADVQTTPGMQQDECLFSRTLVDMPVKSASLVNGSSSEAQNEKLALDDELRPHAGVVLDNCIPLKSLSTGLVDIVNPVAHVPIGEVQNEKLVSESVSSEVLSEMVPTGTLPVRAPRMVPFANLSPKEEPVDLTPEGDEISGLFADMFEAGKDSPRISLRSKVPSREVKKINPKQERACHENNVVHKYPTKRLKKVFTKCSLQIPQSPSPDVSKKEENSRDSSEPISSEEDTSAGDETFNTKKYRRGTITLEATVMKGSAHDRIIERIRTNLKRGLRCNISDEDARQTLISAQRQLTKHNLKQASASEGCLQNWQALKLGSCVVEFVRTGSNQRGRLDRWTFHLAQTVAKYFAIDFCAQSLKVIFFGVTQNTYCAGHAFAATYNRIAVFSADYIPEKLLDEGDLVEIDRNWECPNKGVFSRKSRMAYKNDLIEVLFNIPKWQRERRAVKAERVQTGDDGAHAPIHSVWMEGIPKNATLLKKHGYETMEALTVHCRKACKAFIEKNNWTIVSSKLKDPILW